jgi:hypothetical protein
MNLSGSPIKLCRIKLKIKGGEETFLDCIKRLDVPMETRGSRDSSNPAPLILWRWLIARFVKTRPKQERTNSEDHGRALLKIGKDPGIAKEWDDVFRKETL